MENYANQLLQKKGAFLCKNILSKEMCVFITHAMLRKYHIHGNDGDIQIPNALATLDHNFFLETLHEQIWPKLEIILEEELLPTYTYARLYSNGDELKKHQDRPACEISITVQLGRSHHFAWPIYAGDQRFDLAEGDGVVYLGCDIPHWREVCKGPNEYYSGQAFFHFVRKLGEHTKHENDQIKKEISERKLSTFYVRNRDFLMEIK